MKWLRTIALILVLLQYTRRVENCKISLVISGVKSISKEAISEGIKYGVKATIFNNGGDENFVELLESLAPSVAFSPSGGDNYDSEAEYCYQCLSINGSDPKCENGTFSGQLCTPSISNPYCSIEYGITSDYQRYVRRSCNAKLCQSCTPSLIDITGNQSSKCFPIQCQMCNWNNCNSEPVEEVFDDDWEGCRRDAESSDSTKFSETETCASWSSQSNALLVVLLSFSSLRFLERG